jgi:hypothetical protein
MSPLIDLPKGGETAIMNEAITRLTQITKVRFSVAL